MSLRAETHEASPTYRGPHGLETWRQAAPVPPMQSSPAKDDPAPLPTSEGQRVRGLIEAAVGDVFGVPRDRLGTPSRGKAPIALARQAAMYLAHVTCGLTLTDVGRVFARDRTTVAHACAVIEDRRDDPPFDRALELLEWIVPTLVRHRAAPLFSKT